MAETAEQVQPRHSSLRRLLAALLFAWAVALLIGGVRLLQVGGSLGYVVSGTLLIACAVAMWRARPSAAWLYLLHLAWVFAWAIAEVGIDLWALAPRLGLYVVIGVWMVLPWSGIPRAAGRLGLRGSVIGLALIAAGLAYAVHQASPQAPASSASQSASAPASSSEWPHYGNTLAGDRFAALDQINRGNVASLQVAWEHHSGDREKYDGFMPDSSEATPIKIGDRLYSCSPRAVFALDASDGHQLWRYEPGVDTRAAKVKTCRGVAYHRQPNTTGLCAERILWGTVDARLHAIDAATGAACPGFGKTGVVDLREGMGEVKPGYYFVTSPPLVAGQRVLVGGFVDDNADVDVPSGVLRAFDPINGALVWAWDMGRPERRGAPAAGETYTRGTPNSWAPMAADESLGLAYVPMGNPSPDFWGGLRQPYDERFGSAVVALRLSDGQVAWSFQTTHHDLWDYDVPAQPSLVPWPTADGEVPALVQPTKQGEIFVLDRRTGKPLLPVKERPVPQGAAAGDRTSATQPFSTGLPSLRLPDLKEHDMWGLTPLDQLVCRIWFREARYDGVYTPPGVERDSLTFPGSLGVTDWGGVAVDPKQGVMIANIGAIAYRTRLVPRADAPAWLHRPPVHGERPKPGETPIDYWYNAQIGTPFALHTRPFLGPLDVPCTRPPWGYLVGIDMKQGQTLWRRTLGTSRDSGPMGYPVGIGVPIGTPNIGGSLVTAGGLVFFAGTLDRYLRAFDAQTGTELWRARLPAGGQATPMTYVDAQGRQFIVVSAGGHVGLGTKLGDSTIAYALPTQLTRK